VKPPPLEIQQEAQASNTKPPKIPAVRRGTSRRRAAAGGMHMSSFWQLSAADREITHAISRAGRR
jgi:hypothetical protein